MPTYQFQVCLTGIDPERLSLVRTRLHSRRMGKLWVQQVLDRVAQGESQVVSETNSLPDAWSLWKDLCTNGGTAVVHEVLADGTLQELKLRA